MRCVVVIVKVAVAEEPLLGVTVAGEAAQLAFDGNPLQLILTAELNPDALPMVTVMLALFPATTVEEVGFSEMVKSEPPPVNGTVCGLFGAESEIDRTPVLVPPTVGVNVTLMVQEDPAASVPEQLLVCAKLPVVEIAMPVTLAVPELVSVTGCEALVVFSGWFEKVSVVGASVMAGWGTPVPVIKMICGLLGALSVKVREPTLCPATLGV